jgi:hypothetical protein
VVPVGAPFLYLLGATDLDELRVEPTFQAKTTLAYLTHAGFRGGVLGDHARFAAAVRERESGGVIQSVHWMDSNKHGVLRNYVDVGFELAFSGHRLDPTYLENQLQRLLSVRRVVADQLGTGLLYAAALGREVEIYGQPFGHSGRTDWAEKIERFTRRYVPELLEGPLVGEDARQLGGRELGADYVKPPDELRRILGWSGVRWHGGNAGRYAALTRRRALKLARLLKMVPPAQLPADRQTQPETMFTADPPSTRIGFSWSME